MLLLNQGGSRRRDLSPAALPRQEAREWDLRPGDAAGSRGEAEAESSQGLCGPPELPPHTPGRSKAR